MRRSISCKECGKSNFVRRIYIRVSKLEGGQRWREYGYECRYCNIVVVDDGIGGVVYSRRRYEII